MANSTNQDEDANDLSGDEIVREGERLVTFDADGLAKYIKDLDNKTMIIALGEANGVELDGSAIRKDLEAEAELALVDAATSSGIIVDESTLPDDESAASEKPGDEAAPEKQSAVAPRGVRVDVSDVALASMSFYRSPSDGSKG